MTTRTRPAAPVAGLSAGDFTQTAEDILETLHGQGDAWPANVTLFRVKWATRLRKTDLPRDAVTALLAALDAEVERRLGGTPDEGRLLGYSFIAAGSDAGLSMAEMKAEFDRCVARTLAGRPPA